MELTAVFVLSILHQMGRGRRVKRAIIYANTRELVAGPHLFSRNPLICFIPRLLLPALTARRRVPDILAELGVFRLICAWR
jgi:hypothetical protein